MSICFQCGHAPPHELFPGFICGTKGCPMYSNEEREAHAKKIKERGRPMTRLEVLKALTAGGGKIEAVSEEFLDDLAREVDTQTPEMVFTGALEMEEGT